MTILGKYVYSAVSDTKILAWVRYGLCMIVATLSHTKVSKMKFFINTLDTWSIHFRVLHR